MSFRLTKARDELAAAWDEAVVYNIERVRDEGITSLHHAYVDVFVEFLRAAPYTLGHLIAYGLPVLGIYLIF